MRKIKEICREIANELNIMAPENVNRPERLLKMSDIMPEEEWKKSGVTCLAARPEMGKSSLAIDLILDAVLWMEKPVVYFSLDMTEKRLVERMIGQLTGIKQEIHWCDVPRLAQALAYLEKLDIYIDDTPGISVSEIESKLQELPDAGMVVIDYIQLVTEDDKHTRNRTDEIRRIVQNITRISEDRQTPVLLLSQLIRSVEYRKNKRPRLGDLHVGFYSGDVDQVIFLYREKVYRTYDYRKQTQDDSAEIIIAKSKTGIKKTVRMRFDEKHHCFVKNEGADFVCWRELNWIRQQVYGIIRGSNAKVLLIGLGQDDSIYGCNDKHLEYAKRLYEKYDCSVVVSSKPYEMTDSIEDTVNLIKVVVCNEPEIYYMDISNGAVFDEEPGGTLDDCFLGFRRY